MALAIETERLTLSLRDESDAEWYRVLVGERGEETPDARGVDGTPRTIPGSDDRDRHRRSDDPSSS